MNRSPRASPVQESVPGIQQSANPENKPFVDPSSPIYGLFSTGGLILLIIVIVVVLAIIWLFFFSSSPEPIHVDYLNEKVTPVGKVVEVLDTGT